ncbi:MAG: tRNA nucleotidyltransferase [Solirubrobacterales bacterium]|nr:tRNA nucleotidyltransferase [Solirubrobacterales bacterium]
MLTPTQAIDRLRALAGAPFVLDVVARTPGAWIVGGAARDALLDRDARELDIVVEGDPGSLLDALGGERVTHARFGTATVTLDGPALGLADTVTVDVARARAESYAAPGALPDVEAATVQEDLHRRDVSVNAIALRPPTADGGDVQLLQVPGALDDLRDGVLRVLHDRSFADDPTRLWRMARYAARLGFAVDPHTAALAARADPRTVSGPRLGNELRMALREPDAPAVLRAARALNPRLLPAEVELEPRRLPAALALLGDEGRADLMTLAACCGAVDAATLVAWLSELGFSSHELDIVAAGSRASTYMPLHRAQTGAEIARAARGTPTEVVALAGGPQAERWLTELRHVRLQITGDDLKAAGVPEGPAVGRALAHVLDRRLDGTLEPGRAAELAAALAVVAADEAARG